LDRRFDTGIELRRPRVRAVFFLRFDAEDAARAIGSVLEGDGYAVDLAKEPAHWLVSARGDVRKDSFDVAEAALTQLAETRGGRLAGWRLEEPG
jgi:hypothetical protein